VYVRDKEIERQKEINNILDIGADILVWIGHV
jgi:hypothetical protein